MDFTFSDEQVGLRDVVRRLGQQAGAKGDPGDLWQVVSQQLGLTAIGIAEDNGGAGGDFVDAAVVIEEAGRTLLPAPLTTTLVAGAVLQRVGPEGAALASAVAAGDCIAAVAESGDLHVDDPGGVTCTAQHVLDGDVADALLLAAPEGLWWVNLRESEGTADVRRLETLDESRGQARVSLERTAATRLGDGEAARAALDLMRVALSLEAVGAARHCLEMTVAHLKTREQFGRPIGSFQALQHRAADLVVALEAAASTAYAAAWAAAESPEELAVLAPAAKSLAGEAAWQVAAETIQMHGGIGFTWEHAAHRYFKRITTIRLLFGNAAANRQLVAQRQRLGTFGLVTPQ